MVPQELIAAFGAVPIRLCGGLPTEQKALPRDCCPLVTSSYSLVDAEDKPFASALDAVIVPMVCDWKSRFAEILAGRLPTFRLRIPLNKRDDLARCDRLRNLSQLMLFLEEVTGQRLSRRSLLRAIEIYQKASYATRRLADCLLPDGPAIRGSDLLLAMNVSFFDDATSWTDAVMKLVAEAQNAARADAPSSENAPRLLLTGAPIIWPNWKLPGIVEEAGGRIVAEELCSGVRVFCDPVKVDEPTITDMLRALAERYSLPCTCPCFVPNDDRIYRNVSLARRYRVHGVIYHNIKGCFLYQAEAEVITKKFRELNLPVLQIETDYSLEDRQQLSVRVEAFIEMMRKP